jgi:hypothetical protein
MPAVTAKVISQAYEAGLGGSELIFEADAGPPNIALQRPRCARRLAQTLGCHQCASSLRNWVDIETSSARN